MSKLTYMEKLLEGVEVEWKPIADIADIYGGLTGKSKADFESGNAKYISYKNIFNNIDVDPGQLELVKVSENERQHKVRYGDILFTGSSEIAVEAGMSSAVTIDFKEPVYLNSFSFGVRFNDDVKLMPEFSKYLFRSRFMRADIAKSASGVTRFNVSKARFKKILVPIPCPNNPEKSLAIQAEIVRILDAFTAMTAELTAELNLRKKQYNYYRDQLLSFEEGEVEWKTLGDLTTDKFWIMPATPKFDENEDVPYITSKNIRGGDIFFDKVKFISRDDFNNLSRNRPILAGDFLISMIGTIGEIARVKKTDLDFYGQNMYLIRLDESLLHSGYFLHFFDSPKMKSHFNAVKNNSGQGYLKANNIDCISVPVPSLSEQKRIAAILDKFDALTNSITEGLPREIELRQKQYEYYRDLLLSFPKPEAPTVAQA